MSEWQDHAVEYAADVHVAAVRAGSRGVLVATGWCLFPFGVATVLHPEDAIGLGYKLQGLEAPAVLTAQQMAAGFIEALAGLAVLVGFQLVGTALFYRRVRLDGAAVAAPTLWPLAALIAGVLCNAAWFCGTGQFDLGGCIVGLSSIALTVGAETVCEKLGRDFVFGPAQGQHPASPQQLVAFDHGFAPQSHQPQPQFQPW